MSDKPRSIFDRTFADDAPETVINLKTLMALGYNITMRVEDQRYIVALSHRGTRQRKKFTSSLLENALDAAIHFAREYDTLIRGES